MTAAALAAGVISSQAQGTVYSQNVVGYITQSVPGNSYAEFANQLVNGSDANQSNDNANTILASGMISGTGPGSGASGTNTTMLVFNGTSYIPYYYYNATDAANNLGYNNAGWYSAGGTPATVTLPQGGSVFLQNNFSGATTVTITGTVLQGTNNLVTVPNGYSLLSLGTPISTNIDAPAIGLPDASLHSGTGPGSGATGNNDEYLYWNGSTYVPFYFYNAADAANNLGYNNAGFYSAGGTPITSANYPAVGQGFVFLHNAAAFTYTNTFEVQ